MPQALTQSFTQLTKPAQVDDTLDAGGRRCMGKALGQGDVPTLSGFICRCQRMDQVESDPAASELIRQLFLIGDVARDDFYRVVVSPRSFVQFPRRTCQAPNALSPSEQRRNESSADISRSAGDKDRIIGSRCLSQIEFPSIAGILHLRF